MSKRYRSSITGKMVSKEFALENPDTTVVETVEFFEARLRKILNEYYDSIPEGVYEELWALVQTDD